MPMQTRSQKSDIRAGATKSTRSSHTSTARINKTKKSTKDAKSSRTAKSTAELRMELATHVNHSKKLEKSLEDVRTKLKDAEANLEVPKHHHQEAMQHTYESKKAICRFLELSMTSPQCMSLEIPMKVFSDNGNHRLATIIKEQENNIRKLKDLVEEIQDRIKDRQKDVRRLRYYISLGSKKI